MAITEQKQKIFKARVVFAVYDVLGRVPRNKEFDHISMFTRAICKETPGLRSQRKSREK